MPESTPRVSFLNQVARRRFQTQASFFILLWGTAVMTAVVVAFLWVGGRGEVVGGPLTPIFATILAVTFGMTVAGIASSWLMAGRYVHGATAASQTMPEPHVPGAPSDFAASRGPWRSLVKDPLTGLFNQHALLAFVDDAIPYFRRYKRGVSILMVEIDHFEGIIDKIGASGADQALRHVADVLDLSVRKTDKVSCFGANRFVVMLREIHETDTLALANRIRVAVSDLGVRHADRTLPVTVSIGASVVADSDMCSETLIERAEIALETAQSKGGNLVAFKAMSNVTALANVA